jgi:hypothetical protein
MNLNDRKHNTIRAANFAVRTPQRIVQQIGGWGCSKKHFHQSWLACSLLFA